MLEESADLREVLSAGLASECLVPCIINTRAVAAVDIVKELGFDMVVISAVACLEVDQHAGKGFEFAIAEQALDVRTFVCDEMLTASVFQLVYEREQACHLEIV